MWNSLIYKMDHLRHVPEYNKYLVPEGLLGKWSEHGRRARVIYNLETLEI